MCLRQAGDKNVLRDFLLDGILLRAGSVKKTLCGAVNLVSSG